MSLSLSEPGLLLSRLSFAFAVIAIISIFGCSGGGTTAVVNDTDANQVEPPVLVLSSNSVRATVGVVIEEVTTDLSGGGQATSFSISPEPANGLIFDSGTGHVSGLPTAPAKSVTYTVTAENSAGGDSASFSVITGADDASQTINFIPVPAAGDNPAFMMSTTEITYEQFATFLNEAYALDFIRYELHADPGGLNAGAQNNALIEAIYDSNDNLMTNLNGSRVVKDHNVNSDNNMGYELEDMENPLNMNFIKFDVNAEPKFFIEDPSTVDFSVFFDNSTYPNVVDSADDWFELDGDANTFHDANADTDGLLPTLDEVKTWPANFITYYAAAAFAKFYGYELPTLEKWKRAARADLDFDYATSDGTASNSVAWIGSETPGWPPHKGHVQPANSKLPNPLGIYHLGGNAWEWVKDWHDPAGPTSGTPAIPTEDAYFVDDSMTLKDGSGAGYKKGLMGGSFNYFWATMDLDWNHSAFLHAGNDHFGFRVVKEDSGN